LKLEKEVSDRIDILKKGCYVSSHHDADGITSLYFITLVMNVLGYYFPKVFGDPRITVEKDGKMIGRDSDLMLDMVPRIPSYRGLSIDHHVHVEPFDYLLVHDSVPACLIVYNLFKDEIPEKERWKLAVGLVGDGRSELIPSKLWKEYPVLNEQYCSYRTSRTGFQYISKTPIWFKLSAPINYACRVNKPKIGLDVLTAASEPLDILTDTSLIAAKDMIEKEVKKVSSEMLLIDIGKVIVGIIESEYVVESILAGRMSQNEKKPIIILNKDNGNISMRGVSTDYIVEYLSDKGYEVGGHSGFAGGFCDREYQEFLKDIRGL